MNNPWGENNAGWMKIWTNITFSAGIYGWSILRNVMCEESIWVLNSVVDFKDMLGKIKI